MDTSCNFWSHCEVECWTIYSQMRFLKKFSYMYLRKHPKISKQSCLIKDGLENTLLNYCLLLWNLKFKLWHIQEREQKRRSERAADYQAGCKVVHQPALWWKVCVSFIQSQREERRKCWGWWKQRKPRRRHGEGGSRSL